MLVEESRIFEVATFRTLHLYQNRLDQSQVLLDVITIADEVDRQLGETVSGLCWPREQMSNPRRERASVMGWLGKKFVLSAQIDHSSQVGFGTISA